MSFLETIVLFVIVHDESKIYLMTLLLALEVLLNMFPAKGLRSRAWPGLFYSIIMFPKVFGHPYVTWFSTAAAVGVYAPDNNWNIVFAIMFAISFFFPQNLPALYLVLSFSCSAMLLKSFPKCFSMAELCLLSTGVSTLMFFGFPLESGPTSLNMAWHLAAGIIFTCILCVPLCRSLLKTPSIAGSMLLYLALGFSIFFLVSPVVFLRSGRNPWMWALEFFIVKSPLLLLHWFATLVFGAVSFPIGTEKNTKRKYFHALILIAVLPGYSLMVLNF